MKVWWVSGLLCRKREEVIWRIPPWSCTRMLNSFDKDCVLGIAVLGLSRLTFLLKRN